MSAPRLDRLDRNFIINGNFDFWQRGVGPTQISSVPYVADRWSHTETLATGAATIERSTDVPNSASKYSAKITVTAAQAPAAGEVSFFQQVIEGNIFHPARGKDLTLSFYVKSSVTGSWYLSFRNGAVDRTLLKMFTISVANTWQKVIINFTHDETGTWLYDSGAGLRVAVTLAAGTNWLSSTVDAWQSGQYYGATGLANLFAVNGSTLFLSQMKLTIGEAEDHEEFSMAGRDYAEELRLCQRYCFVTDMDTGGTSSIGDGGGTTAGAGYCHIIMPVDMRAAPVPTKFGDVTVHFPGAYQAASTFRTNRIDQLEEFNTLIYLVAGLLHIDPALSSLIMAAILCSMQSYKERVWQEYL
jgi:hypothetical protein